MRKKIPAPRAEKILALLGEGPATTRELEAELGWPARLVAAHLSHLCRKGLAKSEQFGREHRQRRLWSIAGGNHA